MAAGIDDEDRPVCSRYFDDDDGTAAPRDAGLGEDVEEDQAELQVAAI